VSVAALAGSGAHPRREGRFVGRGSASSGSALVLNGRVIARDLARLRTQATQRFGNRIASRSATAT